MINIVFVNVICVCQRATAMRWYWDAVWAGKGQTSLDPRNHVLHRVQIPYTGFPLSWLQKTPGLFQDQRSIFSTELPSKFQDPALRFPGLSRYWKVYKHNSRRRGNPGHEKALLGRHVLTRDNMILRAHRILCRIGRPVQNWVQLTKWYRNWRILQIFWQYCSKFGTNYCRDLCKLVCCKSN